MITILWVFHNMWTISSKYCYNTVVKYAKADDESFEFLKRDNQMVTIP